MKFNHPTPLILALCLLLVPGQLLAQDATADPYQALVKREFGSAVNELAAIEKQVETAKPGEHAAIEARLIAVLETPGATMPGKQFACQMLRLVGSRQCVPSVAKLLTDETLSHMARITLQGINDPAADQALREALGKTQGKLRIGIINSLGDRGEIGLESGSLTALAGLLANGDGATVNAALEAIGKIGSKQAADALDAAKLPESAKATWAQAYLRCATRLTERGEAARAQKMYQTLQGANYPSPVRAGAFREIVFTQKEQAVPLIVQTLAGDDKFMRRAALAAVIEVPGKTATAAFARQLAAQTPDGKATLLAALAARGDGEGLTELVNKLAASEDATIREAAISALGRLGNASSVPVLVVALKDTANSASAMRSLAGVGGAGVAESLVKQVETGDAALRANLLGVLADRKQVEALPIARKLADNNDQKTRDAAIRVLSALGTQEDLQSFADAMLAQKTDGEREALGRAMKEIGSRLTDKTKRDDVVLQAFSKANAPTKTQLLPVLLAFAGDKTLQATRGALAEPGEVHKAAVRALAQWPDTTPLADLRTVAKNDADPVVRILALRGWIGMIGKSGMKTEEKVQSFREALEVSTRPEEKRQVLGEIGRVGHVDSLKLIEPHLTDDSLKREALQSYEQIAESLIDRQPAVAREALQKVLAATTDNGLREKAQAALLRIK
jgi:HEAT repeat protein